MHRNGRSYMWMNRPLNPLLLEYAAKDISLISSLYDYFVAKGIITNASSQTLMSQSERYIQLSISGDIRRRSDRDWYRLAVVVACDVLQPCTSPTAKCRGCTRHISIGSFETSQNIPLKRRVICRVCASMEVDKNWGRIRSNEWVLI